MKRGSVIVDVAIDQVVVLKQADQLHTVTQLI